MGNIPSKPVVVNQEWTNGVTKLNQTNLTSGVNQNITNIKTAVDGIIDALGGPGADPKNFEEITWTNLKALRDAGQLVPGKQYRITDYVTTCANDEEARSAGHPFDIIVTADSDSVLNEDARAALHEGDTYFGKEGTISDQVPEVPIFSWIIKYTIDNDSSKFAWADSNGKGVIYYMKDEWGNECSYDFKNIQFKRYKITECEKDSNLVNTYLGIPNGRGYSIDLNDFIWCYTFTVYDLAGKVEGYLDLSVLLTKKHIKTDELGDVECACNVIKSCYTSEDDREFNYGSLQKLNNIVMLNAINDIEAGSSDVLYQCSLNHFDVTCHHNTLGNGSHDNVFGNYCHYNTFGNTCSSNILGDECCSNFFGSDSYRNALGNACHDNISGTAFSDNNLGNNCGSNTFGYDCYGNTFGYDCYSNTFGDAFSYATIGCKCDHNTFGDECIENSFGKECSSNTFGDECSFNTFGNDCRSNTFGNECKDNTFNDSCSSNTLGYSCGTNTFDKRCSTNKLGSESYSNTFGAECFSNTLGDSCSFNTLGAVCSKNTFGAYCRSNTFSDNCHDNTFGSTCDSNTFGTECINNTFGKACSSNILGDNCNSNIFGDKDGNNKGCNSNIFGTNCHDNTFGDNCESNTLGDGCSSNSFNSECFSNTIGNNCESNTFGAFNSFIVLGDNCLSNTFDSDCECNTLGDYSYENTFGYFSTHNAFGSNCRSNTLGRYCSFNSFGDMCRHNTVGSISEDSYVKYCIYESGVEYTSLTSPDAPSNNNYIQNVHLHLSVKGASTSDPLVISVPRALPYETEYYLDDLGNLTVSNFSTRIAWEDLKTLRDTARLVPGKQYRIVDYLTAVEQPECRSAGHPFDIVVTALTANTLSEDAKAVMRDGDNYFVEPGGAAWKPGITISDIEPLYKMADYEGEYNPPIEKARTFTQMGTMVNPVTGIEVPYLFEPDPDGGGESSKNDRRFLFVGEYEFNGVVYDQWEECYVDGTPVSRDLQHAFYELTNVVVDSNQGGSKIATLAAWKLKYCLDNDYDRFGFAVRHDVIRVGNDGGTSLYLRYPSLDGDDGLAWVFIVRSDNMEIEDTVDYDDLVTSDVIYTTTLSVNVGDTLDMSGTSVSVLATRIGKGVIYEMEDEWGNKLPYDFKNVQFKRYRATKDSSDYDGFDGQYVGCEDITGAMAFPQGYTIENDFKWCYTFNWYNEDGESEDYSIVGNTSLYNDDGFISGCYNNVFGTCMENVFYPSVETPLNRMYLGNNVIWDAYEIESGLSFGFCSNTAGSGFFNNTVGPSFTGNVVEAGFCFNTVGPDFDGNNVGSAFYGNVVGGNCAVNTVGADFQRNTIGDSFQNNIIGNYFYSNTVGNDFQKNTVGNEFSENTVGQGFSWNTVGNYFVSNTVKVGFTFNTVGNEFSSNTVGESFSRNTVGNSFGSNTMGNHISKSSMKEDIHYITLGNPSGSFMLQLKYITIGPSVKGDSSSNPLVITPLYNKKYEQEYISANKVVHQV